MRALREYFWAIGELFKMPRSVLTDVEALIGCSFWRGSTTEVVTEDHDRPRLQVGLQESSDMKVVIDLFLDKVAR